ncbi:MAG: CHAT domain-containing protein [Candidatus Bathyarchaeota archaeon]|nr:CHAT domain-containing protein [Candidatus Bathyarchaeota archaeon]
MPLDTTDVRSNSDRQILHAAEPLSKSVTRRKVFTEIYRGKTKGRTAEEIALQTGLDSVRVLQEALVLFQGNIVNRTKTNGLLVYSKDDFINLNKDKILRLAVNDAARARFKATLYPTFTEKVPIVMAQKPKMRTFLHPRKNRLKILFITANPKNTVVLRLEEEVREIDHRIMLAQKKDEFDLVKKGAVRVSDLQLYLNQEKPTIVHFSGHGTDDGQIVLEDNNGIGITITPEALARVFKTLKDNIRCVVLNACFSLLQAQAINQYIDCVIGMSSSISDHAAIAFSSAFYLGLASERSVKNAFDQGINELMLLQIPEEDIPKLLIRDKIDASKLVLCK